MTVLSPMTEPEFAAYLQIAIPEFAQDKIDSGQWAPEQALELSRSGYAEMLPQGVLTPDHYLFTLRDAGTGQDVGMLWFAAQVRGSQRIAFVYDVLVRTPYQRQGHARRAFAALEERAGTLGLTGIALHVFGRNTGAQTLYHQLGFETTNINMFKQLPGVPA